MTRNTIIILLKYTHDSIDYYVVRNSYVPLAQPIKENRP